MKILITGGATREFIDPMRYITNLSSGLMAYEIATFALKKNHQVDLVSGKTCLSNPQAYYKKNDKKVLKSANRITVTSAQDMYDEVEKLISKNNYDIGIFVAAVADFTSKYKEKEKKKKNTLNNLGEKNDTWNLELTRTKDILGSMRKHFNFKGTLVGFCAETENLIENAKNKLKNKNCDIIVANYINKNGAGAGSEYNEVHIINKNGDIKKLPKESKKNIAKKIINYVLETINS